MKAAYEKSLRVMCNGKKPREFGSILDFVADATLEDNLYV